MANNEELTPGESVVVGVATGAVEVTANLPLWTLKTRVQCDMPFTLKPAVLYRGYTAALSVSTIITGSQLLGSTLLEQNMRDKSAHHTMSQRITSAFFGGAISSMLFGPIDLIGTQYHEHGYRSYGQAVKQTISKLGFKGLFIGTPATAIADGIFVCGFYGCYPYVKNEIDTHINNSVYAGLLAAAGTGVAAATASHIPDMIKTLQQKDAHVAPKSIRSCFYELAAKKNGVGFFKGYLPRTAWLISAVGVAGATAEAAEKLMVSMRKT